MRQLFIQPNQERKNCRITFQAFKDDLAGLTCHRYDRVAVSHKIPSQQQSFFNMVYFTGTQNNVINIDEICLMLEAYNELEAEKRINKNNRICFEKFIVQPGTLTKKQFQGLIKLGVRQFDNVAVIDDSSHDIVYFTYPQINNVISIEQIWLLHQAYNKLEAEKHINENNRICFKKFIVQPGTLTKKQFQGLIKLDVRLENVEVIDELSESFPFNSLMLYCGKRATVDTDGFLVIPNNSALEESEKTLFIENQNRRTKLFFGTNVTVSTIKRKPYKNNEMGNDRFEHIYKMPNDDYKLEFDNRTIVGDVDLSTSKKTHCPGFDIQNTIFTGQIDLRNAVFGESKVEGATFNGGIIFNDDTDFTQWSGHVTMPDDAEIVYVKNDRHIRTTVKELYAKLVEKYHESRGTGFFSLFKSNFIADVLDATDKTGNSLFKTNGEKLFKLLQHMQEQRNQWFFSFRNHRTLDVFNAAMQPGGCIYQLDQERRIAAAEKKETAQQPQQVDPNVEQQPSVSIHLRDEPVQNSIPHRQSTLDELICDREFSKANIKLSQQDVIFDDASKAEIKKIMDAAYRDAFDFSNTSQPSFHFLTTFLNSEFAKNKLVAEFLKNENYINYDEKLKLSCEITKIILTLKNLYNRTDVTKLPKTGYRFNLLITNRSLLVEKAQVIKQYSPLFWTSHESCDYFKEAATSFHNTQDEKKCLADILPNGEHGKREKLINSKAIPAYIHKALGYTPLVEEIINSAEKIINDSQFNKFRNNDTGRLRLELTAKQYSIFQSGDNVHTRNQSHSVRLANHLQTLVTALPTLCDSNAIKILLEKTIFSINNQENNTDPSFKTILNAADTLNKMIETNERHISQPSQHNNVINKNRRESGSTANFFSQSSQHTVIGEGRAGGAAAVAQEKRRSL